MIKKEENKKEKYPQIILGTDNVYKILISPDVEVIFDSEEAIEEFCKNNDFTIKGEYIGYHQDRKKLSRKEFVNLVSRI